MAFDAHCHLGDARLAGCIGEVLERSRQAGIVGWIQGGVCPDDWAQQLALQKTHGSSVVTAFGLHPWWVAAATDAQVEASLIKLEQQVSQAQAVGELGLDFLPAHVPDAAAKERQIRAFVAQLAIAKAAQKPLVLHVVQAHGEALKLLELSGPFPHGGLVHGFCAHWQVAQRYTKLGLLISVGSAAHRPGFTKLKQALTHVPADCLVLETDAPDDEGSEPACLTTTAHHIAKLLGMDAAHLLAQSTANLARYFPLEQA
jgi:TatD DNase family protein